ncbi:MAG: hypothetical protein ACO204_00810 [Schleiferiaceae bacterium]
MNWKIFIFITLLPYGAVCQTDKILPAEIHLLGDSITVLQLMTDSVIVNTSMGFKYYLDSNGVLGPNRSVFSKLSRKGIVLKIVNGKLILSQGELFKRSLISKSIRYIGDDWIGTYSGIYKNKVRVTNLNYCSGKIRQFGDSTFICWDGLTISSSGGSSYDFTTYDSTMVLINDRNLGYARDIYKVDSLSVLVTSKGIFVVDLTNNNYRTVLVKSNDNGSIISVDSNIYGIPVLTILLENQLIRVQDDKVISVLYEFFEPIVYYNEYDEIFTFKSSFYDVRNRKKVPLKNGMHYVFKVGSQYYGANNEGLFLLKGDGQGRILFREEFNMRSLRLTGDSVSIGSINGLYSFHRLYFPLSVEADPELEEASSISVWIGILIGGVVVCVFLYEIIIQRKKGKLTVNKEFILEYIVSNLRVVTVQNICSKFALNPQELNSLLSPSTAGEIIKDTRFKISLERYRQGLAFGDIAAEVGYSKKYFIQHMIPKIRLEAAMKEREG